MLKKVIFFLFVNQFIFSQQIDFDFYVGERKETKTFSFKYIQQGILNLDSNVNISATIEAFKLSYKTKNNFNSYLTLFSTRTFFSGKKNNKLNTLSNILNPIGGRFNINIHNLIPIKVKEDFNSSLGIKIGKKLIEAQAIYFPLDNKAFIENYINKNSIELNSIQKEIILYNDSLGDIKRMQISISQCHFLHLVIKISNIKKILEIGTFTGLSTLSMALALPENGKLIALDKNNETNKVAVNFFKKAE